MPGPGGDAGWLVLAEAGAGSPCAFACEGFEKMVFVPNSALSPLSPEGRAMLSWDGSLLPVVKLSALQEEILRRHTSAPSSPP